MISHSQRFHWKIPIILITSILLSCFRQDNKGYPCSVRFTSDGGCKNLNGNIALYEFDLYDETGDLVASSDIIGDSIMASYKWLQVKLKKDEKKLEIIASPNSNKHSRDILIHVNNGPKYIDIIVYQSGAF